MRTFYPALLLCLLGVTPVHAGPPFQTDDPEPIDYRNYEFYTFGLASSVPGEVDTQGLALEFNWGALPNTHLHVIIPAAGYLPDHGARAFGLGDMELGIKYRFIQETRTRPQIGTFVMFEIPTGNSDRGLGVGKTWYKLPLWAQKTVGKWTTYGGGGEVVVPAPGYRNYPFGGWLLQREMSKKLSLAAEVFHHGQVTDDSRQATLLDFGGYYKIHADDSFQLLFCYGHSVAGQTENYAYLGLYWTWGEKADPGSPFSRLGPPGASRHM